MTKENYNVFASLVNEVGLVKPYENYSPVQEGDLVVGKASKFTQQLAAFAHKLMVEGEIAETRMKFALDRVERQNLIEEIYAIQQRLAAATAMYELQIRGETKVWNQRLTIRAGGQIVVTEENAARSGAIAEKLFQASERAIEESLGGAPPRGSRMMGIDLSQLAEILGEGGLEAIFGASSPFANGDGRGVRMSAL